MRVVVLAPIQRGLVAWNVSKDTQRTLRGFADLANSSQDLSRMKICSVLRVAEMDIYILGLNITTAMMAIGSMETGARKTVS